MPPMPEQPTTSVAVRGERPAPGPRSMWSIFAPHKAAILLGFVILTGTNALVLVLPRLVNEGIDLIEGNGVDKSVLSWIGVATPAVSSIVIALIVCALVGAVFRVLSRVVLFNVGREVEREFRSQVFAHLSTLSPTYYGKHPTGDLMSRLTNDLGNVRLMSGFALLNVMNAAQIFVATLPLLFALDWMVALAAVIPFPLTMAVSQALAKVMYKKVRVNQEALGKLTSHVQENLAGQQVVRAFSQEEGEIRRFDKTNQEAFDAAMGLAFIRVVFFPLMGLMVALGIAITLYVGGRAILDGRMSIGDLVEFNTRLGQLAWPAIAMGFILSVYQRGKAGLDRLNQVLEAQPDIVDGDHTGPVQGKVEARSLTVRYPGLTAPALSELSFSVEPGHVLGVVGTNASGKSSLVKAIARMLPTDEGELFLDDVDINRWSLSALSRGISVVTDDGFLFSQTLRENLCFARPDATDEEVQEAIEVADLTRDISTFKDGLATMVGERGVTLSGGQKQRVALARALLSRPRLLILDDSLSAVDAETESRIVGALRGGRFSQGGVAPTLIIISHRLSAVREAQEILVLKAGEVTERGTHDELLQNGGLYAELWGTEQLRAALEHDDEDAS